MQYGVFFVNVGPFADPEPFGHLVTTAEKNGYESVWTIEHVVIPVGYQARYPYDPSGKIPLPNDTPMPDPLLPLAYAAALTKNIRLGTGIVILPQRHPFYIAKEAATLDRLCGGRLLLGVGVGWLKEEFDALGIPFEQRGRRTDESMRAMRSLWKAEPEAFESEFFSWGPVEMQPKPVNPNGVPIVIGGHTKAAARRAARYGDGFFPGVFSPQQLRELMSVVNEECARLGRDPKEIEVTAIITGADPEQAEAMADAGADRLLMGYGAGDVGSAAKVEDWLGGFAHKMIDAA